MIVTTAQGQTTAGLKSFPLRIEAVHGGPGLLVGVVRGRRVHIFLPSPFALNVLSPVLQMSFPPHGLAPHLLLECMGALQEVVIPIFACSQTLLHAIVLDTLHGPEFKVPALVKLVVMPGCIHVREHVWERWIYIGQVHPLFTALSHTLLSINEWVERITSIIEEGPSNPRHCLHILGISGRSPIMFVEYPVRNLPVPPTKEAVARLVVTHDALLQQENARNPLKT